MTAAGRPMVPEDLLRLRFLGDPAIAPDGSRVAFVATTLSRERDEYLSQVWVVDTAGGSPRRFTAGPARDRAPRWSPDGRWLAFLSEREPGDKPQLWVMPADGGEPTRLTSMSHGVQAPAWSADARCLVFVARVGRAEGAGPAPPASREITTLRYKANEHGFVHDRPRQVFVVDRDGGPPRPLTEGPFDHLDPVWSPDGRFIAVAAARHEEREFDHVCDLWILPAEGGAARRLTDGAGPAGHPAFSPDGRAIAYSGHRHPREHGRNARIYVVPVEGGPARCLTADLDRTCHPFFGEGPPLWSADGAWLYFRIEDQGDVPVYRVRADGAGPPERVVGGPRVVTALSVAAGADRLAYAATDPVTPAEIYTAGGDGGQERPLTDENRAWRQEVVLGRPERFRYERAGFTLDGWVLRPAGWTAGRRYPTLLNIHGGPHSQYGHGFFDEFQVQAGAGYAVVYVNPRGSQGYGEAFTRAVIGDWGGGDYQDVMAGLDEAVRRFDWLDPERLGVLGGSYGGYLTSWIVGHDHRFRAACSERAVNNLLSMVGTSDIGSHFMEGESGFLPWENPSWYAERSPLTHAPAIGTPLLILHTEDDLRCPMEQAEQLYVALRKLRRPVRFVRFPEGNHELSRSGRPRLRLERFRIILEWFGAHLGPAGSLGR